MLACMTGLRRGIEAVNLDQGSSVPLGFVFQLPDELTPSHITDRLSQAVIFDHVLDGQALHANHLVFVYYACAELVLVVTSAIIDPSVNTSHLETGFFPVLGTFLFLGMPKLRFSQALLILLEETGIANTLPSRESHHRLDAQVKPDHLGGDGKRFDILFDQDGDKVPVCAILSDRDRAGLGILGKRPMPVPRVAQRGDNRQAAKGATTH